MILLSFKIAPNNVCSKQKWNMTTLVGDTLKIFKLGPLRKCPNKPVYFPSPLRTNHCTNSLYTTSSNCRKRFFYKLLRRTQVPGTIYFVIMQILKELHFQKEESPG